MTVGRCKVAQNDRISTLSRFLVTLVPHVSVEKVVRQACSIGGDDCASPPCDSPGRYGRYGYPGEDTDMDTIRGRR